MRSKCTFGSLVSCERFGGNETDEKIVVEMPYSIMYLAFLTSGFCRELVLREVHNDTATETARVGLRLLVRCNVPNYIDYTMCGFV